MRKQTNYIHNSWNWKRDCRKCIQLVNQCKKGHNQAFNEKKTTWSRRVCYKLNLCERQKSNISFLKWGRNETILATEKNMSTCLHFHSLQLTIPCILHAQIWNIFPIICKTMTFMMLFMHRTILHRRSSLMQILSNRSVLDVTWTMTWWILD